MLCHVALARQAPARVRTSKQLESMPSQRVAPAFCFRHPDGIVRARWPRYDGPVTGSVVDDAARAGQHANAARPTPRRTAGASETHVIRQKPAPLSPLAPGTRPDLPPIRGVGLATAQAGIRYSGRTDDVLYVGLSEGTQAAGVFTRSKCPSAPVDWCRTALGSAGARALVVNSAMPTPSRGGLAARPWNAPADRGRGGGEPPGGDLHRLHVA